MIDTLSLRPSLHFATLHPTALHTTSLHLSILHFPFKLQSTTLHSTSLHLSILNFPFKLQSTTLHSTSLHLSTLHFLSFKLHPTTLHYPVIWLNPISISYRFISPPVIKDSWNRKTCIVEITDTLFAQRQKAEIRRIQTSGIGRQWRSYVLCRPKGKKVKCTLVQALRLCTGHTAHRGSRGIALLFYDQRH